MTRRGHAVALAACLAVGAPAAPACEAVLTDHRGGHELARLPLDARAPELRIAFTHSVLGTPVVDTYRFMPQAWLVEEQFEGQGYGLPHAAGPGEQLQREGDRWRLTARRLVDPLVVRPLPALGMRLERGDQRWPLARWGTQAIQITAHGCPVQPAFS